MPFTKAEFLLQKELNGPVLTKLSLAICAAAMSEKLAFPKASSEDHCP
jgi:hypothetical protein